MPYIKKRELLSPNNYYERIFLGPLIFIKGIKLLKILLIILLGSVIFDDSKYNSFSRADRI